MGAESAVSKTQKCKSLEIPSPQTPVFSTAGVYVHPT